MINYIKLKSFVAEKRISTADLTSIQLKEMIVEYAELIMPLNNFLLTAISH
jgi:uncharacterized protein (DUF2461 family)